MKLEGVPAHHAVITDVCRSNRGDLGAFDEAVRRCRAEYERVVAGWAGTSGVRIHLVLSVERPDQKP